MISFKGRHFTQEMILRSVRWYLLLVNDHIGRTPAPVVRLVRIASHDEHLFQSKVNTHSRLKMNTFAVFME